MIVQVGFDRQNKKPLFKELTYSLFVELLSKGEEFFFKYNNTTIDIAYHLKNRKKIFEFNINGYEENKAIRYEFSSIDDLLKSIRIEGKRLEDIWTELEN